MLRNEQLFVHVSMFKISYELNIAFILSLKTYRSHHVWLCKDDRELKTKGKVNDKIA